VICLNPAAVRSILPDFLKLTQMTLAGVTSVKERIAGIQEALCEEGDSAGGAGGNELYDVQGCIPYPFAPCTQFMPLDVFLADERSC
jgi:hypothetical protein